MIIEHYEHILPIAVMHGVRLAVGGGCGRVRCVLCVVSTCCGAWSNKGKLI